MFKTGELISLKSPKAIKLQLLLPIYVGHAYESFKRTFAGKKVVRDETTNNWCELPELHTALVWYSHLSTLSMIYPYALEILPTGWLVGLLGATKPAHCYFVGRSHFYPRIARATDLVCSLLHLTWRAWRQYAIDKRLRLDLVIFLLQSDEQVKIISERLRTSDDQASEWTNSEQQLRSVMCFPVRHLHPDRITYRLKPNRTLEAKRMATDYLVGCTKRFGFLLLVAIAFIAPYVVSQILSDLAYVTLYPGCQPELDARQAALRDRWSATLTGPRIVTVLADMVRSFFLWIDSGLALIIFLLIAYMLNHDLVVYWLRIDTKINRLLADLKRHELQLGVGLAPASPPPGLRRFLFTPEQQQLELVRSPGDGRWGGARLARHNVTVSRRLACAGELQVAFDELQGLLCDFFMQVKHVDALISDILSFGILVWFAFFILFSYVIATGLVTGLGTGIIRIFELYGFLNLSAFCLYLLSLHRTTARSYTRLCSLVAATRELETKLRFLKALEYFTSLNRNTYTLFNYYPFKPTTFVTFVGWNISAAIVIEQMFGRAQRSPFKSA